MSAGRSPSRVDADCPLRPGEKCSLCEPGASGPQDCPAVYLVMHDPELREQLAGMRRERLADERAAGG